MGGEADSYYEYLLKLYVQNPNEQTVVYRDHWLKAMRDMRQALVKKTFTGRVFLAHLDSRRVFLAHLDSRRRGSFWRIWTVGGGVLEGSEEVMGARDYRNIFLCRVQKIYLLVGTRQ